MIATINFTAELTGFGIVVAMIFIGHQLRGKIGGLFVTAGFVLVVIAGIDSAIKLFSTEWSFLERLYHLLVVSLGIGSFLTMRAGLRVARARVREERGG